MIVRFLKPHSFDFFECKARVVRIEINTDNITFSIGVEFIELSEEEEDKLNYYVVK